MADVLPSISECISAYAFVFYNNKFLQTDLREGERKQRMLDIPGGHIDEDETPEQAVVREVFEETGVRVTVTRLVAYKKITVNGPKPEHYRYPYPTSYMAYYLCELVEETPFTGNEEVHGRTWLDIDDLDLSLWCQRNRVLLDEVRKIFLSIHSST